MRRVSLVLAVGCAWALFLLIAGDVSSQSREPATPSEQPAAEKANQQESPRDEIAAEREAEVMAFVQEHQPELAQLLEHLREKLPREYSRALRDLDRAVARLKGFQQRDPERFELELKRWTAQTRAQLLAARLQSGADRRLLAELRTALNDEYEARQELLKRERDRVATRLERLNRQMAELKKNRHREIEAQLETLAGESSQQKVNAEKTKKAKKVDQ